MAAFRGVHISVCFFIFCLLFLRCILTVNGEDTTCDKPWYISVDRKLTVFWTGDERNAIVTANIVTKDTYGRKCDSDTTLKAEFKAKMLNVNNPCSNALYFLTITLICDGNINRQNLTAKTPPDAPVNVEVNVTNVRIEVKWSSPPGKIELYRVVIQGGITNMERKELTNSTSWIFTDLEPYTLYNVTVSAKNDEYWGKMSPVKTVRTLEGVPDPPEIKRKEVTNVSITVEWSLSIFYRGPDPEYSLRWKLKSGDDKYDTLDLGNVSAENVFTITKLKPFSNYEVQIRARNDAGFSLWSEVLEASTLPGVPSEPRDLKVHSKSATNVLISWNTPDPPNGLIEEYMIVWKTKTNYTNDTSFNATDLAPYTHYDFKVCARTEAGWGNYTAVLKVKTDVDVPSQPLNLTEDGVTNSSISIKWLAPKYMNAPHLSYVIRWMKIEDVPEEYNSYDGDDKNEALNLYSWNEDEGNTTSYEIRDLYSYTNYSVQVCGKTSAGQGNYTNPLILQTAAGIPSSPVGVTAVTVKSTSLTFRWFSPKFPNGPVEGYSLHWGIKGTDGSYVTTNLTFYESLGLRPYTEYFFMVAAMTQGGQGPFTSVYERTAISSPTAPRTISTSVSDHCVLLAWSTPEHPNGPVVQYTIKWRELSEESSIQEHETNSTSYRIRRLLPETNYSIQIRASTSAGDGPWTEVIHIRTMKKDNSSVVIAGSVVGGLLAFFIIACAIAFLLARKKGGLKQLIHIKPAAKSSETLQTTISVPLEEINESEKLTIQNFEEHVLKLTTHGYYKLAQEFEKLEKESPSFSTNEAKKNENLTKNRWVKILPFDHSRVKLRPAGDEVEPDFINASYVPGDSYLLEYIATQGPLPNTVNDFWKMVWQESVFLIVMLTQCVERAKRTCEKYWPGAGTTNKYGDIEVHSISESITPAYIQRIFLLTQDGKQRHIVHLHYMNWPVSGCPKSPDDFLSFVRTVRGQVSCGTTGPMLVHCSAGIGRTGTFITVDRLSQLLSRQNDEIDVYGTVLEMRRYRSNLVQTEQQYYFIYLCVQRIIQERRQEIEDNYGGGIYSN